MLPTTLVGLLAAAGDNDDDGNDDDLNAADTYEVNRALCMPSVCLETRQLTA